MLFRTNDRCRFDPLALDLIESMLKLNPTERITAEQGLQSPWFAADPQPEDLSP
jgi:serine/threonine protein kinase